MKAAALSRAAFSAAATPLPNPIPISDESRDCRAMQSTELHQLRARQLLRRARARRHERSKASAGATEPQAGAGRERICVQQGQPKLNVTRAVLPLAARLLQQHSLYPGRRCRLAQR